MKLGYAGQVLVKPFHDQGIQVQEMAGVLLN